MTSGDYQDRIIQLLLSEALGGQSTPDLATRILANAFPPPAPKPAPPPAPIAEPVVEPVAPPARRITAARRDPARFLRVAALVAAAIGLWFLYLHTTAYPAPKISGDASATGGAPGQRGSELQTRDTPVRLTLGDYCRLDLAPHTVIRLAGAPRAEAADLVQGKISSTITAGLGTFAVQSSLGRVFCDGGSFDASLVDLPPEPPHIDGEPNMLSRKLLVAVFSGAVTVTSAAGETTTLAAGQQQAFAASAAASTEPATPTRIGGTITAVSGDSLSVQTGTVPVTIGVTAAIPVKINGKRATLADLKPGMAVAIYITTGGTQIFASTPAATHPAPAAPITPAPNPASLTGTITAAGNGHITIQTETKTTTFTVPSNVAVYVRSTRAAFADLKVGMRAQVYTRDGTTAIGIRGNP